MPDQMLASGSRDISFSQRLFRMGKITKRVISGEKC